MLVASLVQVFTQHPHHRTVVLDELLNTLLKLPTTGRKLRTFELAEEDNMHIQMITAVLLQCIQGCVSLPEEPQVCTVIIIMIMIIIIIILIILIILIIIRVITIRY
jgi:hypothetical protein